MLHFLVSDRDKQRIGEGLEVLQIHYSPLLPDNMYDIEVTLVDSQEIQQLNREHRQIDEPTDVLSFPLYASLQELPIGIPCLLGSIIICPEQVTHYGESLIEMVHHGILHLIGVDHETDRAVWDAKEKEALGFLLNTGLRINAAPQ